jgi:multiple antibiotic resistance protein
MSGQLRQIVEGVLLVFAALLPIVNPFGGAPVFLAMTADCSAEMRKALAQRVAINAFLLLLFSVFVGTYVLDFFGLSVPIVQVAGGLVVCALGWDILRQDTAVPPPSPASDDAAADIATRAFYPLTLPLTVGPGTISVAITLGANHSGGMRSLLVNGAGELITISVAITLGANHSGGMRSLLVNGAGELIGVTLIAATILLCYRYADRMLRILGAAGTSVLVRLSAFILLCIGVQILWNGVSALAATLPLARGH